MKINDDICWILCDYLYRWLCCLQYRQIFFFIFWLCTLIYLSPLIKLVRTSSTKLNRNDKGKHFSFIPKFKGNIHHQDRPVATEGLEGCLGQDVSEEVQTCLYWERTQDKNLIAIYEKKFSGIFMFFLLPDLWKSSLSYFPKLILIQKLVYYPKVTCNIVMDWGTDPRPRVSGSKSWDWVGSSWQPVSPCGRAFFLGRPSPAPWEDFRCIYPASSLPFLWGPSLDTGTSPCYCGERWGFRAKTAFPSHALALGFNLENPETGPGAEIFVLEGFLSGWLVFVLKSCQS